MRFSDPRGRKKAENVTLHAGTSVFTGISCSSEIPLKGCQNPRRSWSKHIRGIKNTAPLCVSPRSRLIFYRKPVFQDLHNGEAETGTTWSRETLCPVALQRGQFCSEAFYCVLLLPSPGDSPAWADLGHSQPGQSIPTGAEVKVPRNNN